MQASHHVLQQLVRGYATRSPPRGRLGATLSLDHVSSCSSLKYACQSGLRLRFRLLIKPYVQFLQRSRALSLYRTIIRATRRIRDPKTRAETRKFARDEFERHRNVTDLVIGKPCTFGLYRSVLACYADLMHRIIFGTCCQQARPSGRAWRGILMVYNVPCANIIPGVCPSLTVDVQVFPLVRTGDQRVMSLFHAFRFTDQRNCGLRLPTPIVHAHCASRASSL